MIRWTVPLILFLLLARCSTSNSARQTHHAEAWVNATLQSLTLEQKVGQIFAPAYRPQFYSVEDSYFQRFLNLVERRHIGSFTFYRGEPYAAARCINRLQKAAQIPLLVMSDIEWGLPQRVDGGTRFLQNMAVGATGSSEFAYQMGEITASEAKAVGIHLGFCPVLDVNNNPDNIIINTRSYGESPDLVSRLGVAYIRGMQENGVFATAKHFPGHGDTDVDSHLGLPTIHSSRARMDSIELAPFRAAVEAGVKSIMVSHITYSAFEEMRGRPASLDRYFIEDVLRKEWGYKGLVITDAMNMGGITDHFWSGEAAVMAINAGIDIVLMPQDFEGALDFVTNAVRDGRISIDRIDSAVRRVLSAKAELGLHLGVRVEPSAEEIEAIMANPQHLRTASKIANAAITLVRDNHSVIPFKSDKIDSVTVVTITDVDDGREFSYPLRRAVSKRVPNSKLRIIDGRSDASDIEAIISEADSAQNIVIGAFLKWGSHKGSLALNDSTASLLTALFQLNKPIAVVAFGSPYLLRHLPDVPSYICAYDTDPLAVEAATQAIFGETAVSGKLPVSIPGVSQIGAGLERSMYPMRLSDAGPSPRLEPAFDVLRRAITDSVFPGAQVMIIHNDTIVAHESFGTQTYAANSPKIDANTIYDLASITKVAATTMIAMRLWEQNKLELDIPVKSYLPQFSGGMKDSVTVRHLLTHSSGVLWWTDLWNKADSKEDALKYIYDLPLNYVPGDSMIYTDLGLIMLGRIIETITRQKLDVLAADMFYKPLDMNSTMYTPTSSLLPRIAPTEIGGSMNRGLIHGEVHDENTHFLDGVSSHAGLFSTAADLGVLAEMLLNGGIYAHRRYYKPATIDLWSQRQPLPEGSNRALGWVTPLSARSSAGDFFSTKAFGHTGFTGTSLWIDPDQDVAIILLTNRVHPTRERGGIYQVRRDFHNAAMQALLAEEGQRNAH